MARKKGSTAKDPPAKVVRKMPDGKFLKTFVGRCNRRAAEISTSVGELREEIATAVEKKGVHKGVLALLRKLDKMEPEKLSEYLDHLDFGLDVCGLRERAESAPGLPIDDEKKDEDEEDTEEAGAGRRRRGMQVIDGGATADVG